MAGAVTGCRDQSDQSDQGDRGDRGATSETAAARQPGGPYIASQVKPKGASPGQEPEELTPEILEDTELPHGKSAPEPEEVADRAAAPSSRTVAPKPSATSAKPASRPSATSTKRAPRPSSSATKSQSTEKPAASSAAAARAKQHTGTQLASSATSPTPQVVTAPAVTADSPESAPPARQSSVTVPHTDHVRVEVPAGLQRWLDEDDRMRPWLRKAVSVADACYASERADAPGASGVVALQVTMHENARPSGRVSSVSPAISGIVMCATTRMLGVKMPLFTGAEGESHTVRVRFDP